MLVEFETTTEIAACVVTWSHRESNQNSASCMMDLNCLASPKTNLKEFHSELKNCFAFAKKEKNKLTLICRFQNYWDDWYDHMETLPGRLQTTGLQGRPRSLGQNWLLSERPGRPWKIWSDHMETIPHDKDDWSDPNLSQKVSVCPWIHFSFCFP